MDHPIATCIETAEKWIKRGAQVYQKFTCARCGERQTMDVPNTFYAQGRCEECNGLTDITAQGCNYMIVLNRGSVDFG